MGVTPFELSFDFSFKCWQSGKQWLINTNIKPWKSGSFSQHHSGNLSVVLNALLTRGTFSVCLVLLVGSWG